MKKTILLLLLAIAGIFSAAPNAQARERYVEVRSGSGYGGGYRSYGGYCERPVYYQPRRVVYRESYCNDYDDRCYVRRPVYAPRSYYPVRSRVYVSRPRVFLSFGF